VNTTTADDARTGNSLSHGRPPMTWLLSGYKKQWFPSDLLAGVSVAAVALPIAIAYSQLAGVPAVHGLYASLLPLVAYALLGSSRQLIIAPDAATCAIVAAIVAPLAGQDQKTNNVVERSASFRRPPYGGELIIA